MEPMNSIFKNTIDNEIKHFNRLSQQECYFSRTSNGNIRKYFSEISFLEWEKKKHKILEQYGIVPEIVYVSQNTIEFDTRNLISLRHFLESRRKHATVSEVINELYSFVNSFKKIGFVHGNLTIDTVYIHTSLPIRFKIINCLEDETAPDLVSIKKSLVDFFSKSKKYMVMLDLL